jgi:hypothetical protein
MKQYLLMGTAALALVALSAPAEARGKCDSRRFGSGVVQRVRASRPVVVHTYGHRAPRPVVVRSYARPVSRTVVIHQTPRSPVHYVNDGYDCDRLGQRIARRDNRAYVHGFRTKGEYRRFQRSQERARERAERLRVRRVGWDSYDRDCR